MENVHMDKELLRENMGRILLREQKTPNSPLWNFQEHVLGIPKSYHNAVAPHSETKHFDQDVSYLHGPELHGRDYITQGSSAQFLELTFKNHTTAKPVLSSFV